MKRGQIKRGTSQLKRSEFRRVPGTSRVATSPICPSSFCSCSTQIVEALRALPSVPPATNAGVREEILLAINSCKDVTTLGRFSPAVDPVEWVRQLQGHLECTLAVASVAPTNAIREAAEEIERQLIRVGGLKYAVVFNANTIEKILARTLTSCGCAAKVEALRDKWAKEFNDLKSQRRNDNMSRNVKALAATQILTALKGGRDTCKWIDPKYGRAVGWQTECGKEVYGPLPGPDCMCGKPIEVVEEGTDAK